MSRRLHHRIQNQGITPYSTHAERQRHTFAEGKRSHSTCCHTLRLRRFLWLPHHATERDTGNPGIAETLGNDRHGGASERERGGKHQHDICRRRLGQVRPDIVLQRGRVADAGGHPLHGHLRSARPNSFSTARRSGPWHHTAVSIRLPAGYLRRRQR